MFGIEDARIHDPMEPVNYVHFIGDAISHDYYKKWLDESSPLLDRLNVRWLMTEPNHELSDTARYALRYAGPDGRLYENLHAMPRFFADGARVTVTSARRNAYTLDVDAARPTTVMSSIGWSPWWSVSFRTGAVPEGQSAATKPQPITTAQPSAVAAGDSTDPFLSFPLPAGHTTVQIHYVDNSFSIASLLALLTAAVLVCFMIRARVQRHMDLRRRALRDRDRLRAALDPGGP